MFEFLTQDFLGVPVRGGDEIGWPLERGLQVLDLAEIALERAAGVARGLDHHVEKGRAEHGGPRSGNGGPAGALNARSGEHDGGGRGLPADGGHVKSGTRATPWARRPRASPLFRRRRGCPAAAAARTRRAERRSPRRPWR